ncbi:hypothetical protein ACAW74_00130 [Fibrella sp. WM1]|uniref:hypothetical protein n=1 Tax=Fibrella musci TaxID=3242485 RepID=UPI00351FEB3F
MKQARSTYPTTYLWLLTCLFSFSRQTFAQELEDYKKLGWAEHKKIATVAINTTPADNRLNYPSPEIMLKAVPSAENGVKKFAAVYPGKQSILFTNELLRDFEQTQNQTEGFHLFLGMRMGRLVPIIVHTDINREQSPGWSTINTEKKYYRARFDKAYFWNYDTKRWAIKTQFPPKLKKSIKSLTDASSLKRKGFFLAKGALLAAWKQSGEQPLKLYFTIQDQELHLFLPYCLTTDLTAAQSASNLHTGQLTLPVHYFYTVAGGQQAVSGAISAGPGQTTVTGSGGSPGTGPVFKTHGSVRCCPSYCGGLDEG